MAVMNQQVERKRKRKRDETRMQREDGWDATYVDEWSDGGNDKNKTNDDHSTVGNEEKPDDESDNPDDDEVTYPCYTAKLI
jgi:hypothetical protein